MINDHQQQQIIHDANKIKASISSKYRHISILITHTSTATTVIPARNPTIDLQSKSDHHSASRIKKLALHPTKFYRNAIIILHALCINNNNTIIIQNGTTMCTLMVNPEEPQRVTGYEQKTSFKKQ